MTTVKRDWLRKTLAAFAISIGFTPFVFLASGQGEVGRTLIPWMLSAGYILMVASLRVGVYPVSDERKILP